MKTFFFIWGCGIVLFNVIVLGVYYGFGAICGAFAVICGAWLIDRNKP